MRASLVLVLAVAGCAARPVAPRVVPPMAEAPVPSPTPEVVVASVAAAPAEPMATEAPAPVATATPAPIGSFQLTYYLVADEKEWKGKKNTTIYGEDCKPLAKVTKAFAKDLALEGTGKLRDGRMLNWAGRCAKGRPKYKVLDATAPWGLGVKDYRLSPFRSIATDPKVVATGTKVYVAEFDGVTMPALGEKAPGFVHDGCVDAVDVGEAIDDLHIDFFAGTRAAYHALDRQLKLRRVTLYDGAGRCDAKN